MQVIYLRTVIKLFRLLKIFFFPLFSMWDLVLQAGFCDMTCCSHLFFTKKKTCPNLLCPEGSVFPTVQQRVLLHSIIITQPFLKGSRCLCDLCALHRLYLEACSGSVPRVTPAQRRGAFSGPVP